MNVHLMALETRARPGLRPTELGTRLTFVIGILLASAGTTPAADPAAWGSDHVGLAFPEYRTGEECLFCHRDIGPTWPENAHFKTIRRATQEDPAIQALTQSSADDARDTAFLTGAQRVVRYLRRAKAYGKLEMLSTRYRPENAGQEAGLIGGEALHWDTETFADRCAGCHTTAVDVTTRSYSALSLDCFTCHGEVVLEHTEDISRVLLSKENSPPLKANAICSQCHLRGGKSNSSGLPYPNTFVAGDNLFRDFQVDWRDETIKKLPAIEQHIYLNARQVATTNSTTTCIDCHKVHGGSSEQHQGLEDAAICATCHKPNTDNSELLDSLKLYKSQRSTNRTCDY